MKKIYKNEVEYLAKAADIAIEVLEKNSPTDWTQEQIKHLINFYLDCKSRALNREEKYSNLKSLKFLYQDIFTLFQESTSPFVETFWKKIKENNLPFERINQLDKILKKGKINNLTEYNYTVDLMVPFFQEGRISENQLNMLKKYIGDYEIKNDKKNR